MEIRIRKTNGRDEIFKSLIALLDDHLNRLNGKELQQERYAKFNTTDSIENAFVLYMDDKAAACGAFKEYERHVSELKRIYVKEEYRHSGLASLLIHYIEKEAVSQGYYTMILESAVTLKGAHQLYYKLGYQLTDNFGPFAGMETSLCMKKELE